ASNPTTVNLNFPVGLPAGTYTILEATGTIKYGTDNKGVILGKIINLGHRLSTESAEIQYEQGALKIKLTASNRNLVWSAGTLDSKWHYSGSAVTDESNWILADDPYKDDRIAFLNNDFVTFSGAAPQTVDVDAAATVAGLTVSGGNYTFSNAQITGGASAAATGVLTVAGANTQATFNNALDFESCTVTGGATLILGNASNTFAGGVTVDGKLKLNHADALKSGDVTLQNGATLDLAHSGAGKYTIASLTATDNATLDFGNLNTLAVSGAADFTGGAVRLGITLAPGQTVDAIVADGSITGSTFTTGGNYMVEIVDGKILRISHLVATYGQTLADVPLPAGWTWDEPSTTPAGDVGTHTHTASRTDAPAVSGQPFSITVAPATLTFPVLQDTTVVSHEGNYLHDFPLLPGYAWAEPDRWIANCGTYELKVIYTHPSNNYKPVEGWVTVTIPCYAVPGSQKRQVFLPQVPGMTSNPPAGVHYVASGTDFIFTLTPQAPMQGLSRPSLTVETVPKTDVLITPQADGSYTVRIPVGIPNIQIKIQVNTLETANETVPTARVWAGDRTLYIAAATAGEARVYAVTGQLLKTLPHLAGETVTAQLPLGMYIVVAEGKAYKIMIGE
ncbi:MAG: hypothetical protein LBB90_07055, partial [Tannerella sp.]|nr:hypothetical protein [Tannerella sp.]